MSAELTTAERREAIASWCRGKGWVPVAALVAFMRDHLQASPGAGAGDLRWLCNQGLLERRAPETRGPIAAFKAYEYHVPGDPLPDESTPVPPALPTRAELQRQRLRDLIAAHPDERWLVSDLAEILGCPRCHAQNRVNELVGEGLLEDVSESGPRVLQRCA